MKYTGGTHSRAASPTLRGKMCRPLLPLMLITGALLISTEGQGNYHRLPGIYKDIADQAIQHCNQNHLQGAQHINFLRFLQGTKKYNPFYIELHLKATDCSNTWKTTHQDDCKFISKAPFINCAFCYGTDLKTSFIHCTTQRTANEHTKERNDGCKGFFLTGASHVLGETTETETTGDPAPECLGRL
ncbi:hypothetical protein SKAU_G00381330 [Synaphobranchus kaupii]|uniref:Chemerin n=1 Tax=Synaphobranchus kaupii TaxID=118154 RepID=A0A9Q1ICN5_SYNKA|nr:hypothetical protein SKAU_G00381330 [Synaphobranchus kaupii]